MMDLQIAEYTSTNGFGPENWDTWHNGAFYLKYDFLKLAEEAKVNNATYRFLTFSRFGKPVGAAVLSAFQLQLDLLAGDPAVLKPVKKLFPGLLQVPVVCCGMPVSFGQHHFCALDHTVFPEMLTAVNQALEKFAAETKAGLLAWKEFSPCFKGDLQLQRSGYLKLRSLPDMEVVIPAEDPEAFFCSVRAPYRRKLNKTAFFLGAKIPEQSSIQIKVEPFTPEQTVAFYEGYLAVMQRTATQLETYDHAFFDLLAKHYQTDLKLLTVKNAAKEAIAALLLPEKETLHFLLVSKPKAIYGDALYAEMVKAITIYGVKEGFKKIKLGQTSYYSKMAAGAKPLPLNIYLQAKNSTTRFILKHCGKFLFPETPLPTVNFYKKDGSIA